jgi:DNA-binding transcriptional LysR family regulator
MHPSIETVCIVRRNQTTSALGEAAFHEVIFGNRLVRNLASRMRGRYGEERLVIVQKCTGPHSASRKLSEAGRSGMLDWDDLRFFLAVARTGSLSAAARELRCTQTTVGRRLVSLEAGLGVRLLNRTPRGYIATPAGESVRNHAERIEREALAVERVLAGQDERLEGRVTVACIESIANNILAPCFAALHRDYPAVVIELLPPDRHVSLARRDADISIHHVRPKQREIVVRRIGSIAFGLYASPDYLKRFGTPNFADGCAGHRILALPDQFCDLPQMQWLAGLATKARVVLKTPSYESRFHSILAGDGMAYLPRFHGDKEPKLMRIDETPTPAPVVDVWLAIHKDNRNVRRIRAVIEAIASAVSKGIIK